jgi:hypothetical protein
VQRAVRQSPKAMAILAGKEVSRGASLEDSEGDSSENDADDDV